AFVAAAGFLACALAMPDPWLATWFCALSVLAAQATQPLWWSCAISVSGRHVGALFGLMNSIGVFGAMSSQSLVGALADWTGERGYTGRAQWDPGFHVDLAVLVCAAIAWLLFRVVPVEASSSPPGEAVESA